MLLKIEENMTIDQINADLHTKFPHIKLVFFKPLNSDNIDEAKERVTELYKPLKNIYKGLRNAHINVNGNLQARSLELKINEITGARVQIFRRSGKLWLETLTTDNKTLAELSRIATDSITDVDATEPLDYQEHD